MLPCRSCGTSLAPDAAYCSRCGCGVELGSVLGVGTDLPHDGTEDHPSGRVPSRSGGSIVAMLATFLVLTVVGTVALTRLTGSDPVAPTTVTAGAASEASGPREGQAAPGAAPASPTSPSASPSEPAPESDGAVPVDGTRCSRSGDDAVATAYAGTERTSCELAGAVRTAYRKAGTPSDATSLRAFSPVTKKWYSLSCDGGEPVRCTSTTGAVVVLTAA